MMMANPHIPRRILWMAGKSAKGKTLFPPISSHMVPCPVQAGIDFPIRIHGDIFPSIPFPVFTNRADLDTDSAGGYVAAIQIGTPRSTGMFVGLSFRIILSLQGG